MSGGGRTGGGPLETGRTAADVGPILETWMAAVAPARAPERLLEESFARTMVAGQQRAYPWHAAPRSPGASSGPRRFAGMALVGIVVALALTVTAGLVLRPTQSISGPPTPAPSTSTPPNSSLSPFPSPVVVAPIASIPVTGVVALATDGSSIWLLTNDGKLARIDPVSNTIAATVTLAPATDAYQSLAGAASGLWVTDWDAGKVLRFDPATLKETASVAVSADISSAPKGVLVTSGAVWVADTRRGSVVRIDPKTNKLVATVVVGPAGPAGPNWLGHGFGSIWTGVPNSGVVVRINEATNAIEASIPIVGQASPCGGLATTSSAVWITSCDGSSLITQIDPATNTVVGPIDLGGTSYTWAIVADRPWISPTGGQIVRLDPVSHAVDRVIAPGAGFASGGGDVVVAAGSMWVMDWSANRVLRLPIAAFGG